jgi:hypothetical protein
MSIRLTLSALALLALSGCARATPAMPVVAAPTATATVVVPTVAPTVAALGMRGHDMAHTPAPAVATASLPASTPTNPAIPTGLSSGGVAGFRDKLATADQFVLVMQGVAAPPSGQVYQGWLIGDDGLTASVGALAPSPDGRVTLEWSAPNSENLLGRYARFQITLEQGAAKTKPAGKAVFDGALEGQVLASARQAMVRNTGQPATPLNTAFAPGLRAQTNLAVQHVQNAVNADAIGARAEMRVHLEHVVNILEGGSEPRFGDHDGSGKAENPGDGFGVLGYSKALAGLYADRSAVASAAQEAQAQMAAIENKCLDILKLKSESPATASLKELMSQAVKFQTGAVASLYDAAQAAVSFQVSPVK